MPLNTKLWFCSICYRLKKAVKIWISGCHFCYNLAVIEMSIYDHPQSPQFSPMLSGLTREGIETGANRKVDPTFLFDFYTHHTPILHRLAAMHNAADRQTDRQTRAVGIGRLCISIGGVKLKRRIFVVDHDEQTTVVVLRTE